MNPEVTDYINKISVDWQAELCRSIRHIIHQSIPTVVERIQYSKPHFLKDGKYAAVLGTAKGWVSFTIFNAQSLVAPDGYFEPSDTDDRKTVKFKQGQALDHDLLAKLLQKAATS